MDRIFIAESYRSGRGGSSELARLYAIRKRYIKKLGDRTNEQEQEDRAEITDYLNKFKGQMKQCLVCKTFYPGESQFCSNCGSLNTENELNAIASFKIHVRNDMEIDDLPSNDPIKILFNDKKEELWQARPQNVYHLKDSEKKFEVWHKAIPNRIDELREKPLIELPYVGRPREHDIQAEKEILAKISDLKRELPYVGMPREVSR